MFVNRKYELEILDKRLDLFLSGKWENTFHLAFLGLRRTGKTYLLNHFLGKKREVVNTVYFNMAKYSVSPYSFSKGLVQEFLKSLYGEVDDVFSKIDDIDILRKWENIEKLFSKKDLDFAIDKVFELITYITDKEGKFIVVIDEFQEFFSFENYPKLKNIEAIFRDNLEKQLNIFYVLSGSFPTILKDILNNPKHYLYSHFEIIDIYNFDKKNTVELIKKKRSDLSEEDMRNIFYLTYGNPYLINSISVAFEGGSDLKDLLKKFLFNTNGKIYNYCLYILEESLNKIPGKTNILAVIKEVSLSDGITLTEILEKTYMDMGAINKAVNLLKKVDLIYQMKDKTWHIESYIFKYFLKYYFMGIDDFENIKSDYMEGKLKQLQEEFLKVSTELGRTKEYELFFEIKEKQGGIWEGLALPLFKTIKKNYFASGGDEIDLYAETGKGQKWFFELKYKNKKAGDKEIEKFMKKGKGEADRYVFVSKSGFSKNISERYFNDEKLSLISLN